MFSAFTEEFVAAPFTDQIYHLVIPAFADAQTIFPYEPFLNALLLLESKCSKRSTGAPWLFYFVLTVGENYLGMKHNITFDPNSSLGSMNSEPREGCTVAHAMW